MVRLVTGYSSVTGKSLYYVLDENQNPVPEPDVLKWAEWFGTKWKNNIDNSRIIKKTLIGSKTVSTIFTSITSGLDYEPLLWATGILINETLEYEAEYATKEEALADHERIVKGLKEGKPLSELRDENG